MEPMCPTCGRPRVIVSRHPTSEGEIVYTRCACGLRALLGGTPVLRRTSCSS